MFENDLCDEAFTLVHERERVLETVGGKAMGDDRLELIGVAPETISVWKRHPQWQRELDRWRELAETPLDATQLRLKLESLEAMTTALEQLQLLMGATKPVSTGGTLSEEPDWPTRLKACRLVLAITFAVIPEFQDQYRQTPVDHRLLRLDR